MLRLACGIAVVAYIFLHSPERPATAVSDDATRWADRVQSDIAGAALRSDVAESLLRRHAASGAAATMKAGR